MGKPASLWPKPKRNSLTMVGEKVWVWAARAWRGVVLAPVLKPGRLEPTKVKLVEALTWLEGL